MTSLTFSAAKLVEPFEFRQPFRPSPFGAAPFATHLRTVCEPSAAPPMPLSRSSPPSGARARSLVLLPQAASENAAESAGLRSGAVPTFAFVEVRCRRLSAARSRVGAGKEPGAVALTRRMSPPVLPDGSSRQNLDGSPPEPSRSRSLAFPRADRPADRQGD
ncbi:hypothetical protein SAMN05421763_1016 [[Luteovulum] sphaeroides subsp. megalophilum]|nr:hypothetical protein SAMN05421763_1016 [[Luteovulum] sphaeroides subsp. megalophilum]